MSKSETEDNAAAGLSVLAAQIEAVLFLSPSPVTEAELKSVLGVSNAELTHALNELGDKLSSGGHGLVLKSVAGGWMLVTNPYFAEVLSRFRDTSQRGRIRLSRAAVETAAVIAYNQPVTRSGVEELRGVRSDRVIETLLSHGLIRISGRKKSSGSPLLYRTTPKFLEIFGLDAIADLPNIDELSELGGEPVNSELVHDRLHGAPADCGQSGDMPEDNVGAAYAESAFCDDSSSAHGERGVNDEA